MKNIIIELIKHMIKFFLIFPIKKNRIVLSSYSGKNYSCNPKYITEELLKEGADGLELIWAFVDPKAVKELDPRIKKVRFKSILYLYYVLTARVVVDNVESWSILPKRSGQTVINTWHGGGAYKGVGLNRLDTTEEENRNMLRKHERVDVYLSSSRVFSEKTLRGSFQFKGQILECGMPRNDILINDHHALVEPLKRKLGLKDGVKYLLFAPTFRKDISYHVDLDLDGVIRALTARFGGTWAILYRAHYYVNSTMGKSDSVIDVSAYDDMQELLIVSDALLTDYSSSIWDYSFTNKPAFLYTPDLDDYTAERRFYTPIESWPYHYATDIEELYSLISRYSEKDNEIRTRKHHDDLGSFELGTAAKTTSEIIFQLIK